MGRQFERVDSKESANLFPKRKRGKWKGIDTEWIAIVAISIFFLGILAFGMWMDSLRVHFWMNH